MRATAYTYDPLFLEHNLPGHPENRTRLERIMAALRDEQLLDRMTLVPPQPADLSLLARVHDAAFVKELQAFAGQGGGHIDADTYVGRHSFDAARLAAGGAAELVRAVLNGRAQNGIALVRPPGHHAVRASGMGFCLLNNVAVAAQAALDEFGLQRVLIVDWDVHHGNGTQDIFYDCPRCFSSPPTSTRIIPEAGAWARSARARGAAPRSTCRCRLGSATPASATSTLIS